MPLVRQIPTISIKDRRRPDNKTIPTGMARHSKSSTARTEPNGTKLGKVAADENPRWRNCNSAKGQKSFFNYNLRTMWSIFIKLSFFLYFQWF
jgi:hypothetical protein